MTTPQQHIYDHCFRMTASSPFVPVGSPDTRRYQFLNVGSQDPTSPEDKWRPSLEHFNKCTTAP